VRSDCVDQLAQRQDAMAADEAYRLYCEGRERGKVDEPEQPQEEE
jgi:hypothetical protein